MAAKTLVLLLLAALLTAADWPQFRGPNATGISGETNLPVEFGPAGVDQVVFLFAPNLGEEPRPLARDRPR